MEQEEALPPKAHRQRHDGFTPRKKRKFFKALKKTGCISDAARAAGISTNTVRRHRDKWPAFNAKVEAALGQAADGRKRSPGTGRRLAPRRKSIGRASWSRSR